MQVVLTIVDTAGIQDYIFSSNRLRENIGASHLVEQATHDWVYEALPIPNNLSNTRSGEINVKQQLAEDNLAAELIYAGGGNALILFHSLLDAQTFARGLSRRVLHEAPGLEIVIAHSKPFEWSPTSNDLRDKVQRLREDQLTSKKRSRRSTSTSLLGLGVTAKCSSTGLAATRTNLGLEPNEAQRGSRLISREIATKLKRARN